MVLGTPVWAGEVLSIEAFTTSERAISGADQGRLRSATVTIYTVDGLGRFESGLSADLPADPEAAKAEALRRIQQLDDTRMAPARSAAMGLARAVQYGVDCYPAVVFDGSAVIYGVTDLEDALERYAFWREGQAR
ncbi:MAG: TIGR03757 family integrating conjugative element protein [Gammaproteobacteria bacterium]|nr:TIGR03757 family integrating conjugative element protein [Gammaproteobacteria bacterium]